MHRPVRIMCHEPRTMINTILCKLVKNVNKFRWEKNRNEKKGIIKDDEWIKNLNK